jgi:hypothetical protein
MENHDEERGTASQAVQHFEVLFSATGAVDNYGDIHQLVAPRGMVWTALSRDFQRQLQTVSSRHGEVGSSL